MYSLSGHTDKIVCVFFEQKSFDLITVSRNAQVCLWEACLDSDDLVTSVVQISHKKRRKLQREAELVKDEVDEENIVEKDKEIDKDVEIEEEKKIVEDNKKLQYNKLGYIGDAIRNAHHKVKLTSAA